MSGISVKMDLIKLDMVVKDIHHIWSEIPSRYIIPKSTLAEARSVFRSNVKKALAVAEKARRQFQKESVIATRYNLIAEQVPEAGETAKRLNNDYNVSISAGEYDKAEGILDSLIPLVSKSLDKESMISMELLSSDDEGCILMVRNGGDYPVSVSAFSVTKGSEKVRTEPRNTFTVQGKSSRKITVSASAPVHVSMQYTERGENRSIDQEV